MEIHKMISAYNYNPGSSSRIRYLVIHYVGALGGAKANCEYYGGGNRGASAHYYVDFDGTVWQCVEDRNIAWHCGAARYVHPECRNANSLGIELCVRKKSTASLSAEDKDWYFEDATVAAAAELTKQLMEKYRIPLDHVIRHYDVTGKICPNPYVYNTGTHTWQEFRSLISAGTASGISSAGEDGAKQETADGQDLVRAGQIHANNFCSAGIAADGIRGPATKKAGIMALQTGLNLDVQAGLQTDGILGEKTKAALKGRTVRRGDTGYLVTALQILLLLKNCQPGGVENPGIFGANLQNAVSGYQTKNGLSVDGIAGSQTFQSLVN